MDPISQGAIGAIAAQTLAAQPNGSLAERNERAVPWLQVTFLGCAAGMAPDLDVFIQSASDPLLFLEFHRHFTHALAFIPIGALLVATALYGLVRSRLSFGQAYLACLLGFATHGLLDACTTYGTQLLWPFSTERIAWNNVSVVDPLFTLPLLACVILAATRRNRFATYGGIAWVFTYLSLGVVQMERAESVARSVAEARGHTPARLSAKASFANLLVWKSIYEHDGRYYVDGVRVGADTAWCPGESVEKLEVAKHLPFLHPDSQQARDLERFRWFSDDYLTPTGAPGEVTDMRYSMVANQATPMWGITLRADAAINEHVRWWSSRETSNEMRQAFWSLLTGEGCKPTQTLIANKDTQWN